MDHRSRSTGWKRIVTTPNRKDRMRPLELLVLSAIVALFIGVVVFISTRDIGIAVIFLGIAFIVALITLAMLALASKPDADDQGDIGEQGPSQP